MHLVSLEGNMSSSLVMSYALPPIRTSPLASAEIRTFERLLRNIYDGNKIPLRDAERLRGHLHRIYLLHCMAGYAYVLKCPPSRDTTTLRHEAKAIETEGRVLDLIRASSQVPIPQRISSDTSNRNAIHIPYLLRSYLPGRALSSLESQLSVTERENIDRTLGSHIRSMSSIRNNTFGTVYRVYSGSGHSTWREAFLSLIESVLRDCEDLLVSLPYDSIRYYTSAQASSLDAITEPQLVPLQAGISRNVLINEQTKQISGLLGFSHVVWGDPRLAWCFADASTAFWQGYGTIASCDTSERTRQMLLVWSLPVREWFMLTTGRYTVYRSMITIVTFQSRSQAANEELDARRMLNWALNQLAS